MCWMVKLKQEMYSHHLVCLLDREGSCKANDPLATVDADNRPHVASSPHRSAGQSSERVVASAPQLRRQVDDIDPQECEES